MKIEWKKLTVNQFKVVCQAMMVLSEPFLEASILNIYKMQTQEEKLNKSTVEENKIGFSKVDAEEMSNIAQKLLKGEKMTDSEKAKSKNKMMKYWRQLLMLSRIKWEKEEVIGKWKQEEEFTTQEAVNNIDEIEQKNKEELLAINQEMCCECGRGCDYGICAECQEMAGK